MRNSEGDDKEDEQQQARLDGAWAWLAKRYDGTMNSELAKTGEAEPRATCYLGQSSSTDEASEGHADSSFEQASWRDGAQMRDGQQQKDAGSSCPGLSKL